MDPERRRTMMELARVHDPRGILGQAPETGKYLEK